MADKKAERNQECVQVVVRCRPLSMKEKKENCGIITTLETALFQVAVNNPARPAQAPKTFTFDAVYDENTQQKNFYEESCYDLVEGVMEGYNGTIFAYGQGYNDSPDLRGVIPLSFDHMFENIKGSLNTAFLVRCAYLEIYNEEVRDLLVTKEERRKKLELREDLSKGVYVKDLNQTIVNNEDGINRLMEHGQKMRTIGATAMNESSSRSHAIFTIVVEMNDVDRTGEDHIRVGKLNLVDLAGSERATKTGATGERLKEGSKINISLSALGNVISALVDGRGRYIPYRDSKLTRLLQDSLGGNTKTLMVAAISPADYDYEETLSTLRYANRAKNIRNKPKINEDPKDAILRQYKEEIEALKQQLAQVSLASGASGVTGASVSKNLAPSEFGPLDLPSSPVVKTGLAATELNSQPPYCKVSNRQHHQVAGKTPQDNVEVTLPTADAIATSGSAANISVAIGLGQSTERGEGVEAVSLQGGKHLPRENAATVAVNAVGDGGQRIGEGGRMSGLTQQERLNAAGTEIIRVEIEQNVVGDGSPADRETEVEETESAEYSPPEVAAGRNPNAIDDGSLGSGRGRHGGEQAKEASTHGARDEEDKATNHSALRVAAIRLPTGDRDDGQGSRERRCRGRQDNEERSDATWAEGVVAVNHHQPIDATQEKGDEKPATQVGEAEVDPKQSTKQRPVTENYSRVVEEQRNNGLRQECETSVVRSSKDEEIREKMARELDTLQQKVIGLSSTSSQDRRCQRMTSAMEAEGADMAEGTKRSYPLSPAMSENEHQEVIRARRNADHRRMQAKARRKRQKEARLELERMRALEEKAEAEKEIADVVGQAEEKERRLLKSQKKLEKKLVEAREEIEDLMMENNRERGELLDTIQNQNKELQLWDQVARQILTPKEIARIWERAEYNEDEQTWLLPPIRLNSSYLGNPFKLPLLRTRSGGVDDHASSQASGGGGDGGRDRKRQEYERSSTGAGAKGNDAGVASETGGGVRRNSYSARKTNGTLDDGNKSWEIITGREAGGPSFKSVEIDSTNSPRDDARSSRADLYKELTPLFSPSAEPLFSPRQISYEGISQGKHEQLRPRSRHSKSSGAQGWEASRRPYSRRSSRGFTGDVNGGIGAVAGNFDFPFREGDDGRSFGDDDVRTDRCPPRPGGSRTGASTSNSRLDREKRQRQRNASGCGQGDADDMFAALEPRRQSDDIAAFSHVDDLKPSRSPRSLSFEAIGSVEGEILARAKSRRRKSRASLGAEERAPLEHGVVTNWENGNIERQRPGTDGDGELVRPRKSRSKIYGGEGCAREGGDRGGGAFGNRPLLKYWEETGEAQGGGTPG